MRSRRAFGLSGGPPPDRFLVGLAVLGLLSDVADEQPLVCVVDDAQWLDRVSAQILAFVARRLLAESVALVFTVREPTAEPELAGLARTVVAGPARRRCPCAAGGGIPGRLDARVRDRMIAETRGNPLALLQLPRGLTTAELAGGFALPARAAADEPDRAELPATAPSRSRPTHDGFCCSRRREPVGDVDAAVARGRTARDRNRCRGVPAEAAGLIELGAQVRLPSPARALGGLPGRARRASARRCIARWPKPPIPTSIPIGAPGTAPRPRRARRGRGRRARAVGRRAQARGGIAAAAAFLERAPS